MSKTAIITDTHFGARGDGEAMQRNMAKFYEKVFFPALDAHRVEVVLHAGDYGDHRKYFNFQTAQFIQKTYRQPLRDRNLHEFVMLGNHDCFYKHSTLVNSVDELYRDSPGITVVKKPSEWTIGGCEFLFLPWICDENRQASMDLIASTKASLVLGHLEIAGFQMYRGLPNDEGLDASLFDRFELVMSGHFHHKSEKGPIHYLGAPYPMIWSDYRDPRGFHLFDNDTHELTFIENPYSLFARIIYDDTDQKHGYINDLCQSILSAESPYREAYVKVVVKSKTQPYWFDLMMDALYKVNPLSVAVLDDIVVNADDSESSNNTADVDTLTLMSEYVQTLDINCDKQELTKVLQALYHEAITANQSVRFS